MKTTILKIIESLRANAKGLKTLFYVCLVIIVLLDVVLPREESHYTIDKVYAFWTLFTVVGCYLLIKVSKGIAHTILAKDEDYYG